MSYKLEWREVTEEEVRCKATRGRRSRIQCEVYEGHKDSHAGRGARGQWYFWREAAQ